MTAPIWAGKIQRQDKFLSRGSAVYLKRHCRVEEVKKKKAITMQYAKCFRLTAECAAAISFSRHLVDAGLLESQDLWKCISIPFSIL